MKVKNLLELRNILASLDGVDVAGVFNLAEEFFGVDLAA